MMSNGKKRILQHPVPENLLVHIGDMTVSFAMLEMQFQTIIGSLIAEHQRVGQIITAELSFKQLLALVGSLYRDRHGEDDDFEKLRDLVKRAGKIEQTRNQITHSVWGASNEPGAVTRIKITARLKPGLKYNYDKFDEAQLREFVHEIKVLASDVQILGTELIDARKAIANWIEPRW